MSRKQGASANADRATHERSRVAPSPPTVGIPSAACCSCGVSQGKPRKKVTWYPNKKLLGLTAKLSRYRSVKVALGRTKSRGRTWAVTFKGKENTRELAIAADVMAALIEAVRRIEREEMILRSERQSVIRSERSAAQQEDAQP